MQGLGLCTDNVCVIAINVFRDIMRRNKTSNIWVALQSCCAGLNGQSGLRIDSMLTTAQAILNSGLGMLNILQSAQVTCMTAL